jgi:acetolactate synthase small subunit
METTVKIPKPYLFIINQLFELEQKVGKLQEQNSIQRNIDKMKNYFETEALSEGQGLTYHNPIGESYDVTRTDCEATISGKSHENLEIIEVLKPIIYVKYGNTKMIVQKAITIVQSKN